MNLSRLQEEQILELRNTEAQIEQWESFKKDYSQLQERLETLPDKISYDVMVPLGPLAFMPGHLVHTNEILVLLGENWFVEKSAKEACGVIDRRKSSITTKIDGFLEQKKLLESRLDFTNDIRREVSGADDIVDIREDYDSDEEAAWRGNRTTKKEGCLATQAELDQTRRRVVGKLEDIAAEERGKETVKEEEDEATLMARLDELERQEEEMDELARMDDNSSKDDGEPEADSPSSETPEESGKTVRWKDQSATDGGATPTIHFTHSETPSTHPSSDRITSPADIYHRYQSTKTSENTDTVQPKSILKEASTDTTEAFTSQPLPEPQTKHISESAFTGSIVEHGTEQPVDNQPKKRVSKFKQARQDKGQT